MRLVRYGAAAVLAGLTACVVVVDPPSLTEGCGEDAKPCEGRCVSLRNPKTGCASDDCTPCFLQNATARCDSAGRCVMATCTGNWADCDEDGQQSGNNGCETDLAHDPDHCGRCGNVCPSLAHALPGCEAAVCSIDRCEPGFGDCDDDRENGCETSVSSSEHCGGCNEVCLPGEVCEDGACVASG
jgi:hypothetical protein